MTRLQRADRSQAQPREKPNADKLGSRLRVSCRRARVRRNAVYVCWKAHPSREMNRCDAYSMRRGSRDRAGTCSNERANGIIARRSNCNVIYKPGDGNPRLENNYTLYKCTRRNYDKRARGFPATSETFARVARLFIFSEIREWTSTHARNSNATWSRQFIVIEDETGYYQNLVITTLSQVTSSIYEESYLLFTYIAAFGAHEYRYKIICLPVRPSSSQNRASYR